MFGKQDGNKARNGKALQAGAWLRSLLAAVVAATLCWPIGTQALAADRAGAAPTIEDLGIAYYGTDDVLGYATAPGQSLAASITAKGGSVQFDCVAYWSDGSESRNETYMMWEVSDPSIASIDMRGTLTAKADGVVTVSASIPAERSGTGQELKVEVPVNISGQTGSPYVVGIAIADPDGNPFPDNQFTIEGENQLTTYTLQLTALVDVAFPDTGAVQTYLVTPSRPLSSQVPQLSDLVWSVGDENMGAIEDSIGLYKPKKYGDNLVMARSTATDGSGTVMGSAFIKAKNPDSDQDEDGYHPQDSLTISYYYEKQDDPSTPFKQVTYSPSDLEELGTDTAAYTAIGQRGWYAFTGRGVYLDKLFAASGLNDTSSILSISFDTFDMLATQLSGSYVFDGSRCYYPNIDLPGGMQFAEGQPVKPMIALESCEIVNGDTAPNYGAMNEGTRFRLLIGTTPAGGTTSTLIKWISGLHVVVKGSGEEDPQDPDQPQDPQPSSPKGEGAGSGTGIGNGAGEGTGTGADGLGVGGGLRNGNVGGNDPQGENGDSSHSEGARGGTAGEDVAVGSESQRNVFKIDKPVNTFEATAHVSTAKLLLWRVVIPGTAAVLAAGAVQAVAWFRRQTQAVALRDAAV